MKFIQIVHSVRVLADCGLSVSQACSLMTYLLSLVQAERWGTELYTEDVEHLDLSQRPFVIRSSEREVRKGEARSSSCWIM